MRLRTVATAAVLILAGVGSATAQSRSYLVTINPTARADGYLKTEVSKATLGTNPITLWNNASIDPDCTAHGKVGLTILKPPEHGQVVIDPGPIYLAFPPNNPRSACNSQKIPGNQAIYTASSGYVGRDHLVLEGFSPEGHVRRISVDIDVR